MIDKLIKDFFSMRSMALGLLIFLVAIARATFIESDFGTPASKIAIYNTWWFELLLLYLSISLIVNIFRYKMYRPEKIAIFSFHISFLLIIIGAGLTRYVGFEGSMPLKEGEQSNVIYSADPYFILRANDLEKQFEYEEQRWLSEGRENPFTFDFQLPGQPKVNVEYVSYKENFVDSIHINDSIEGKALEFVYRGKEKYILEGEEELIGGLAVSFNQENPSKGLNIFEKNDSLFLSAIVQVEKVDMMALSAEDRRTNRIDSSAVTIIPTDSIAVFETSKLYMFGNESLMFRGVQDNIARVRTKAKQRDEGTHYLTLRLSSENETKEVELEANHDHIMQPHYMSFAGLNFEIGYGAKPIELPFEIRCNEFQLDRYPGSDMASSFASEVTLIDDKNDVTFDQRIFMNNVMDYSGYRFFQSSYYPDESGTVLSVNYDWWGTNVTYLGYLLMSIGMLLSLFAPVGRFRYLAKLIKKTRKNRLAKLKTILVLFLGLSFATGSFAHGDHDHDDHNHDHDQEHPHDHDHSHDVDTSFSEKESMDMKDDDVKFGYLTEKQAKALSPLLVQDYDGRIIPFHTLSDKILRKLHRSRSYNGKNPVQVLASIHLFGPKYWNSEKLIFVSAKIKDQLGLEKYTSIENLENQHGEFIWREDYEKAFEKPDSKKTEYDKKLIKLGERYRVLKDILRYRYLRIVPVPGDKNGTWVWPFSADLRGLDQNGSELSARLLGSLFGVIQEEVAFSEAKKILDELIAYQWSYVEDFKEKYPTAELPTKSQINAEIQYYSWNIFDHLKNWYFVLGFFMLIIFFLKTLSKPTLKNDKLFKKSLLPFTIISIVLFVVHAVGLGYLWYITGRAPWSNGYEAIIFIAWTTVLAGIIFMRKNAAVLPATILLAGMILFVSELNLLDPEITPLQPVLKSYWLMIHVAIITSSYGFLGIAAILAVVNMLLYLFMNNDNKKVLGMNIKEVTSVNEMTMIVGLFLLTIGTFLGGVWANESWGRYWGWDPKETWALVSVLTYAIILHLRFIPKANDTFVFNFCSLWGYSAILFTFFGVNFKLVGLHSYAQGDGVAETPMWVWIAIGVFALFSVSSAVKYYLFKTKRL